MIYHCSINSSYSRGFTLIELLIVLVILGISMSLLAPDMYSTLQKSQAKNEITKIRALAEVVRERSFFSASSIKLTFDESSVTIEEIRDNQTKLLLKKVDSQAFIFELKEIMIKNGNWIGSPFVEVKESSLTTIKKIELFEPRYLVHKEGLDDAT